MRKTGRIQKTGAALLLALLLAVLPTGMAAAEAPFQTEEECRAELFQSGSFRGGYTKPWQVTLLSNTAEDAVYEKIYQGLQNREETITLTYAEMGLENSGDKSLEELWEEAQLLLRPIYEKVVNDHPELYDVQNRWSWGYSSTGVVITPKYYTFTDAQRAQFDAVVERIVKQASTFPTDLEKALFVHDYLAVNCAYNWEVATTGDTEDKMVFNAYGALVNRDAVCQGYALAYILLMKRLGIECSMVPSSTMGHAWNMVKIGGEWYHTDVTWDDPTPNIEGHCGHGNFLLSDAGVRATGHEVWENSIPPMESTKYETGYVFNGNGYPFHYWNNAWYYLDFSDRYSVYRTNSLQEKGTNVTGSLFTAPTSYSSAHGIVWLKDSIYFTDTPSRSSFPPAIASCSLEGGKAQRLKEFQFEQAPSPDGGYGAERDFIGLRYNPSNSSIEAVSSTRREMIGSYQVQTYPVEWDGITTDEVEIAGVTENGALAGVQVGENAPEGLTLYVACYQGGKMVDVQVYPIEPGAGLKLIGLSPESLPEHDRVQLMVLSGLYAPACGSLTA